MSAGGQIPAVFEALAELRGEVEALKREVDRLRAQMDAANPWIRTVSDYNVVRRTTSE